MADGPALTTPAPPLLNVTASNVTASNVTAPAGLSAATVVSWLTFFIGMPAIGLAMYVLKNLSKGENKLPTHVMFLLVSDVISFFSRPRVDQDQDQDQDSSGTQTFLSSDATDFLFYFGIISNVTFMLLIAQERHLALAYPQCLACCGTVRRSPLVAVATWAAPLGVLALAVLGYGFWFAVALLAPFPVLLFFALDSWRALACSRSRPPTPERRRAAWGVGAIWANYTLLYAPFVLSVLLEALGFGEEVRYLGLASHLLLYLGPLVDPFLYTFITRGPREVLQALPCCRRGAEGGGGGGGDGGRDARRPTVDTVAETVETKL